MSNIFGMVIPNVRPQPSIDPWVFRELGNASFGGARLTARTLRIVSDCARNSDLLLASLYQGDWGSLKACYRFFDNAGVSSAQIWLHPDWGWLGVSVAERLYPALTRPSIPRRRRCPNLNLNLLPSHFSHSMPACSRVSKDAYGYEKRSNGRQKEQIAVGTKCRALPLL